MTDRHKTEDITGSGEGGTDLPPGIGAGEDEGTARKECDDSHRKDDQKQTGK